MPDRQKPADGDPTLSRGLRLELGQREEIAAQIRPYLRDDAEEAECLDRVEKALADYAELQRLQIDQWSTRPFRKRAERQIESLAKATNKAARALEELSEDSKLWLTGRLGPDFSHVELIVSALVQREERSWDAWSPPDTGFRGVDPADLATLLQDLKRLGVLGEDRAGAIRRWSPPRGKPVALGDRALTDALGRIWEHYCKVGIVFRGHEEDGGLFGRFANAAGQVVNPHYSARSHISRTRSSTKNRS